METRFFKPGDRVQKRSGGPVMIVQRYAREYTPWVGWHESDHSVECSWYDPEKGYRREVINQNNLVKVTPEYMLKGQFPARRKSPVKARIRN